MPATRTFQLRHVQLARAAFAAVAALMVTFSVDHSASVGLAVFSGFALVTGLIFALGGWLAAVPGGRWPYVLMAVIAGLTGMAAGIPAWRTTPLFFVVVIAWGALGGSSSSSRGSVHGGSRGPRGFRPPTARATRS